MSIAAFEWPMQIASDHANRLSRAETSKFYGKCCAFRARNCAFQPLRMCVQVRRRPRSARSSHRGCSCTLRSCNSSTTQRSSRICGASAATCIARGPRTKPLCGTEHNRVSVAARDARRAASGAPPSRLLSSAGRQTRPPSRQRCFARTLKQPTLCPALLTGRAAPS